MKNFTLIPNEIFEPSQLSALAVLLYCNLVKHCGKDDWCFPGQVLLGKNLRISARHVRDIMDELINAGLVYKKRRGYNRSNTYKVSKQLQLHRNGGSYQIRSYVPLHTVTPVPPKSTYLKAKGKRSIKGLSSLREVVDRMR